MQALHQIANLEPLNTNWWRVIIMTVQGRWQFTRDPANIHSVEGLDLPIERDRPNLVFRALIAPLNTEKVGWALEASEHVGRQNANWLTWNTHIVTR
jgi:hypothetical protein